MLEVEAPKHGLESIGPFDVYKLTLDGYRVPRMQGRVDDKGMFHLKLDERFGIKVPEQYAYQVVWMIANAMAIGAGYSCFGEDSQTANPFKVQMSRIGLSPDIEMPTISDNAS